MRPYSQDLRQRAISQFLAGKSIRFISDLLEISPSSVVKWWRLYRETGDVKPKKVGGYRRSVLVGEVRDWLLERIRKDFTTHGLVAELSERGVKTSNYAVWKFLRAEGYRFKKKSDCDGKIQAAHREEALSLAPLAEEDRPTTSCFY